MLCRGRIGYFGQWNHGEWAEILAAGSQAGECEADRCATRNREPLGSDGFVAALERHVGRSLRVGERNRPGTKPELAEQRTRQGGLLAVATG